MSWTWHDCERRICEQCVNRCAEHGDVGDEEYHCPFTGELEEFEKLFHSVKALEQEYYSMLWSGVDEDNPKLMRH